MKIIFYFLLIIFTLAYAVGIAIDAAMFLAGGLGGPYQYSWMIPAHLIIGTVFFVMYVLSLRPGTSNANIKLAVYTILLVIILPLPIFFISNIQSQSEKAHSDYEATCRNVELEGFKYRYCSGSPGTYSPGVSVIGFQPGDAKFNEAMKIWDQKGWQQFKPKTE